MAVASTVSQFMVRNVVDAKTWHPVSYIRQQMLTHAFSYLPILHSDGWKLVPEYSVARLLRSAPSNNERKRRLATTISSTIAENNLELLVADIVHPETPIAKVLPVIHERPVLVVERKYPDALAGLLTASDIL